MDYGNTHSQMNNEFFKYCYLDLKDIVRVTAAADAAAC